MSNIVVIIKKTTVDVSILKELHKIVGGSLVSIRKAINGSFPVLETEIFDNQYEEKASMLRKLISLIRNSDFEVELYEIPEGHVFESNRIPKESLISVDILENILDSSDQEMVRQQGM